MNFDWTQLAGIITVAGSLIGIFSFLHGFNNLLRLQSKVDSYFDITMSKYYMTDDSPAFAGGRGRLKL